ncbi:MAG: cytochrome c biogenesis protein ResB, partial [Cyclobacteriaceae bacterium]|nr:cytochrome c biogenesis protein ResB [Cyclobacteriaceae bacterium]
MDPLKIERSKEIPSSQPSGKTVVMKQHKASNQWAAILRKIMNVFFSTSAAGLYIVIFAAAIGAATFVENDFGTSSAQKLIYKSWWFELILVLFGISLLANIRRFRMIKQKKWATLTFHAAMIVILAGAGITRYFGSEGIMHIREGNTTNVFLSSETYLQFQAISNGQKFVFEEPVLFATLGDNQWKRSYLIGDQEVKIEVLDFIPNPSEVLVDHENGVPVLKLVMAGANGREEHFVKFGDHKNIQGTLFNFSDHQLASAFNIKLENGQLYFLSDRTYSQLQMASQKKDTLGAGVYHPLVLRSLYSSGNQSFVMGDFKANAQVEIASSSEKMESNSLAGLKMKISNEQQAREFLVYGGQGVEARPRVTTLGDIRFAVTYGTKRVTLPFSVKLNDFIMERYPGTNSASSYASEVTLKVPNKGIDRDHRIYMNHILNYGGYRFFQSSYDKDELGTYLSVNHDRWGTWVSYIGYALLTIGMILTMFNSNTRFRQLTGMIKKIRQTEKIIPGVLAGLL